MGSLPRPLKQKHIRVADPQPPVRNKKMEKMEKMEKTKQKKKQEANFNNK